MRMWKTGRYLELRVGVVEGILWRDQRAGSCLFRAGHLQLYLRSSSNPNQRLN